MSQTKNRNAELDNLCLVFVRGTRLRLVTRHPGMEEAIRNRLTYSHVKWARGKVYSEQVACFDLDRVETENYINNHYVTGVGFLPTLVYMASELGCPIETHDVNEGKIDPIRLPPLPMDMKALSQDWHGMRDWQRDAIKFIRCYRRGRIGVATGSGKSWLIRRLCHYLSKSRILITAKGVQNLRDLYNPLVKAGIDVQCIDGNFRGIPEARVICCTTGSLGRIADIPFDICFGDEVHEQAAPGTCEQLWQIKTDRMFGFSANMEDRPDGGDLWSEAIYGPVVVERTYQDNVAAGDVVQIHVRMMSLPSGPVSRSLQPAKKNQVEIWQNQTRNKAFTDVAKFEISQGKQVLLLTNTTEHALYVRKLLNVPVVFKNPTEARSGVFMNQGLLLPDDDFSDDRNNKLSEQFALREIQCIIANSLWRQGKDFPSLDVLCRLDATTTAIPCTQASGRLSRVYPGKAYGKLYDCWDEFSKGRHRNAKKRASFYRKQRWKFVD